MLLYNSRSRCRCCCLWPFCFLDLEHYGDPVRPATLRRPYGVDYVVVSLFAWRRERVAIQRLQVEPFVVEDLEGLLDVVAFLQSLGLLVLPPLCLRLGLLGQESRVRRAVLVSVLFADLLFLLLGGTSARLDPGRSARNVEVMRVDGG